MLKGCRISVSMSYKNLKVRMKCVVVLERLGSFVIPEKLKGYKRVVKS